MGVDVAGIGAVAQAAKGIADKFFPDKTEIEKAKLAQDMQEIMNEYNLIQSQLDIDKIEAASTDKFVSRWRPAVGWIGVLGFAYACVIEPLLRFIATLLGYTGQFPVLNTEILLEVLFALLGIAGMRTFEKFKNVTKN
jgi:hypothetical protein